MSLFWAGAAQGFHQGLQDRKTERMKAAQLFSEFKRNNPNATLGEFQTYIKSIAGGSHFMRSALPSDEQLQQFANENAERVAQEKRAKAMKMMAEEQRNTETVRGAYSGYLLQFDGNQKLARDATMKAFNLNDTDDQQPVDEMIGGWDSAMLFQQKQTEELNKAFPTVQRLVQSGVVPKDWSTVLGFKPNAEMTTQLDQMVENELYNQDLQLFNKHTANLFNQAKFGVDGYTGNEAAFRSQMRSARGQRLWDGFGSQIGNITKSYGSQKESKLTQDIESQLSPEILLAAGELTPESLNRLTAEQTDRLEYLFPQADRSVIEPIVRNWARTNAPVVTHKLRNSAMERFKSDPVARSIVAESEAGDLTRLREHMGVGVPLDAVEAVFNYHKGEQVAQANVAYNTNLVANTQHVAKEFETENKANDELLYDTLHTLAANKKINPVAPLAAKALEGFYFDGAEQIIQVVEAANLEQGDEPSVVKRKLFETAKSLGIRSDLQVKSEMMSTVQSVKPVVIDDWLKDYEADLTTQMNELSREIAAYSNRDLSTYSPAAVSELARKHQLLVNKANKFESDAQHFISNPVLDLSGKVQKFMRSGSIQNSPLVEKPQAVFSALGELGDIIDDLTVKSSDVSNGRIDLHAKDFNEVIEAQSVTGVELRNYGVDLDAGLSNRNVRVMKRVLGNELAFKPKEGNPTELRQELRRLEIQLLKAVVEARTPRKFAENLSPTTLERATFPTKEEKVKQVRQISEQIKAILKQYDSADY